MRLATRLITITVLALIPLMAGDWPRFRGPNGSGVAEATGLPVEFGPNQNVVWKTPLPEGHSSPIISGNRIFLTAAEGGTRTDAGREKVVDDGGRLFTFSLDRRNGEILWKKQAPRPRMERYQPTNSSASPSPVVDAENVYVFFGDFGLISYGYDGSERWRLPLGPFNNVNGHGSSPIVAGDKLILVCDSDTDPYLLAVDKDTGKISWRTDRSETTRSYVTPALFEPPQSSQQLIVPGAYFLASYSVETGEKLWWVRGGGWQPKSTPIVNGGMIYVNSWEGGSGLPADEIPSFEEMLKQADTNGDRMISEPEMHKVDPKTRFYLFDLDHDNLVDARDWQFYTYRKTSRSSLIAVRPNGRGDITDSSIVWSLEKFLPNVPSPLLYRDVLYLVKDGGILTTLEPATGKILKQGRLREALDNYYASPVGADGKVYTISQSGQATVLEAGGEWKILASNDLGDEVFATPAVVDNRLYIRTRSALYCFEEQSKSQ